MNIEENKNILLEKKQMGKTAVLLYGFMRTFKITAKSLLKNIIEPNNADLFVFTYSNEGSSFLNCNKDINKQKANLAKKQDLDGNDVTETGLKSIYGDSLKISSIQKYSDYVDKFKQDSKGVSSPIFPIERFFSLYFNIAGATKLLIDYENQTGIKYDNIILTRPDLNFYSKFDLNDFDLNCLNIPDYGGNISTNKDNETYYCCYYKNIERMEYIPFHSVVFSDQMIISHAENMRKLSKLYDMLKEYNDFGLPVCHPETVLYYHLGLTQNLEVNTNNILYEILRNNYVNCENEFTVNFSDETKNNKYKNKIKEDLINIHKGIKSLFGIFVNIVKYFVKRK